jgi:DtxR family Mn-dependent transcriptional regulator
MPTATEENYLKHIYLLCERNGKQPVTTNEVSSSMSISAASASDMLRRLSARQWIHYKKYRGVLLTPKGKSRAVSIIRRHRLWEYFLAEKLRFDWDQVHSVAEELEHVGSDLLIDKLDEFLGKPKHDPHGDPIPDAKGKFRAAPYRNLSVLKEKEKGRVSGVIDQSPSFLRHLDNLKIHLGVLIQVISLAEFDKSMSLELKGGTILHISHDIAKNILISK